MFVWCTRRTSCPAACCCSASSRGVDQLHRDQSVVIQLLLLTGAHCANHNIAHVKHDGTTMVPHYSRSLLCVCACMSVSPPLGRPVTPRASGMSDSLVDHSPCPRQALITPSGLSAVVRNDSPSSGMLDCPFSRPSVQASHQQCSPFHSLGFDPTWPLHTSCNG